MRRIRDGIVKMKRKVLDRKNVPIANKVNDLEKKLLRKNKASK